MKQLLFGFLLAVALAFLLYFFRAGVSEPIEVYLDTSLPFSFKTSYEPTTMQGVMSGGREKWLITESNEKERLRSILSSGGVGEFSSDAIRVVIVDGKDTYLIDMGGGVQKNNEQAFQIDTNAFMEFQKSLNKNQRRVHGE